MDRDQWTERLVARMVHAAGDNWRAFLRPDSPHGVSDLRVALTCAFAITQYFQESHTDRVAEILVRNDLILPSCVLNDLAERGLAPLCQTFRYDGVPTHSWWDPQSLFDHLLEAEARNYLAAHGSEAETMPEHFMVNWSLSTEEAADLFDHCSSPLYVPEVKGAPGTLVDQLHSFQTSDYFIGLFEAELARRTQQLRERGDLVRLLLVLKSAQVLARDANAKRNYGHQDWLELVEIAQLYEGLASSALAKLSKLEWQLLEPLSPPEHWLHEYARSCTRLLLDPYSAGAGLPDIIANGCGSSGVM